MTLPRKIFIESTALFQLGPGLENVDSAELLGLRELLKFELFVSEVSWREYIRDRQRDIKRSLDKLETAKAELLKYEQPVTTIDSLAHKVYDYMIESEYHFGQKAEKLKINILPLPEIDINRLLRMSIDCTPPFEESEAKTKEKGFRDSLIMFTVLENIRGRPQDSSLLITADKLLTKGCSLRLGEYSTSLSFATNFAEAKTQVYSELASAIQAQLRTESADAKEMLLTYRHEIELKLEQIQELTEYDLGVNPALAILAGRRPEEDFDVQKVLSIRFDTVD